MLALILALTFGLSRPDILKVPVVYAQEIDAKSRWVNALIDCESHASTTVRILDSNKKYSTGLLQFQESTWLSYGKPFGATKENIYDGNLQRRVARSMLDAGGSSHWYNCSKRISTSLGEYPL